MSKRVSLRFEIGVVCLLSLVPWPILSISILQMQGTNDGTSEREMHIQKLAHCALQGRIRV